MMASYLEFKSMQKRYGAITALAGVDLHVEERTVLALLGPNGAGKSTLFGCLLGFTRPTGGEIRFRGERLADADRSRFGYVSERVALYSNRTVEENALFFAGLKGAERGDAQFQLKRVGLETAGHRKVRQLSKGMLQRLGLAIGLCGRPEVLVLDEPFNGLDPAWLEDLRGILQQEQARGATLLISTHTISAIEPLATHVAVLLGGELAAHGTLSELRTTCLGNRSLETAYHDIARERQSPFQEEMPV